MLHKKTDHREGDPLFLCRPGGFELPDQQHDSGSDGGKPPRTSSGGNLVGGFLNRNERAPQCGVATIEVAEQEFESPGRGTGASFGRSKGFLDAAFGLARNDSIFFFTKDVPLS